MILDIYPLVLYFFLFAAGAGFYFYRRAPEHNYLKKPAGERKFCPAEKPGKHSKFKEKL